MQVFGFILLSFLTASYLDATELSFDEAIEKALSASRQVKITQADAQLAKINAFQNIALMNPKISISWNNAYYDSALKAAFNGQDIIIRPKETSLGSLTVQQPLSPLIGLIQKLRADRKTEQAAETGFEQTRVEIAFGAAQAYRQVQQLSELDHIAKDRVKLTEKQEQDALAIYQAGKISKNDLLRIQIVLGQAKVAAATTESQYQAALYALKDLLGYELSETLTLSEIPLSPPFSKGGQETGGIFYERLDIKAAKLTYEAAQDNRWLSIASFLPNLGAFARVDKNFINPGQFGASEVYSIGLNLTWDIWDGGTRFLNMRSSDLLSHKAHLNWLTLTRNAAIDQEQKKLDLKAATESLSLQKITLEQAKEAYQIALEKFKHGAIDTTDLLQSELDFNNARITWAKALADLDIKHMLLQKSKGARRPTSLL